MNSRRLMGTLSPRITPYHIAVGMPLCGAAKSTSGWQLRVKRDQVIRRPRSRHVRFAPKADKEQIVSVCLLSAITDLEQLRQNAGAETSFVRSAFNQGQAFIQVVSSWESHIPVPWSFFFCPTLLSTTVHRAVIFVSI
jgi:hypothetical protein